MHRGINLHGADGKSGLFVTVAVKMLQGKALSAFILLQCSLVINILLGDHQLFYQGVHGKEKGQGILSSDREFCLHFQLNVREKSGNFERRVLNCKRYQELLPKPFLHVWISYYELNNNKRIMFSLILKQYFKSLLQRNGTEWRFVPPQIRENYMLAQIVDTLLKLCTGIVIYVLKSQMRPLLNAVFTYSYWLY